MCTFTYSGSDVVKEFTCSTVYSYFQRENPTSTPDSCASSLNFGLLVQINLKIPPWDLFEIMNTTAMMGSYISCPMDWKIVSDNKNAHHNYWITDFWTDLKAELWGLSERVN